MAAYDPNHLEDQKSEVFHVNLNSRDAMIDFMETFNDFNKDISNRDEIFGVIDEYYNQPQPKTATVKYDSNKGHFVIAVHEMVGGKKKRKTRSKRKSRSKHTRKSHSKHSKSRKSHSRRRRKSHSRK
jgi:hypothetical protein